jgi:hypothetical protein
MSQHCGNRGIPEGVFISFNHRLKADGPVRIGYLIVERDCAPVDECAVLLEFVYGCPVKDRVAPALASDDPVRACVAELSLLYGCEE